MTDYNDSHRVFVQAMLTKRIVTEAEAKEMYSQVCELTNREQEVEYAMFVSNINKELDKFDYSLKISHDECDGKPFLILVNAKQDPLTETATNFKAHEISYIRDLFEAMVIADNEDFAISSTAALHLGQKVKPVKLTQKESQDVLNQLVADKWIAEEQKGVYYMDTRGLAELQTYLREQYGDAIKECTICLDVITMGEHCAISNCPVRIHKYCATTQFQNSSNPVCPQCKTKWSRENVFGLGLPGNDVMRQGVASSNRHSRNSRRNQEEEEEEEEEDEEEDE